MSTIEDLQEAFVEKLLPNIIWMFVCLFVGIVGNTLVLLVYGFHMKTTISDRYFIPVLAFLDLLSSTLSSLHGLTNYFYYINYPSEVLCKIFNFWSVFTSGISAHTLLLIAVQRYRKICVPHGKQMNLFWKRASLIIVSVISLGYSFPLFFTAGLLRWKRENGTIDLCVIDSGKYVLFFKIFYSGVFFIALTNIVAVTALYGRIACSIYRQSSLKKTDSKKNRVRAAVTQAKTSHLTESESSADTFSSNLSSRGSDVVFTKMTFKELKPKPLVSWQSSNGPKETEKSETGTSAAKTQRRQTNTNGQNSRWNKTKVNFNKMFAAIVILYLLSYVPTFISFVVASFGGFYELDTNVFVFLNRLYTVNHIVNPFVYGYFDFSFRHSLKYLLKCGK